jgi:hypothetical protein
MSGKAVEIAWKMAELARELNYATLPHEGAPGLTGPSDVYDVAGALKTMAQRLPQACQQTSRWLDEQEAAGRVSHAKGVNPLADVTEVRAGFELGESAAGELERAMTVAHNASTWLKGPEQ